MTSHIDEELREEPDHEGEARETSSTELAKDNPPPKKPWKIRIPPDPVPGRLELLRESMDKHGVTALLVQSPENRRYFSGFKAPDAMLTESSGYLVITLKGGNFLLTDSRYTVAAKREAPLFEVLTYRRGLADSLKGEGLVTGDLFFEPKWLTIELQLKLIDTLGGPERLKPLPFYLGDFRVVKSPDELHLIKRAVEITEKSLGLLWPELEPGVSENWVAYFLENKFRALGAEGPAFPCIVASGRNAALPHAEPSNKKFGQQEMVVIDVGARYKGYASDMTRTFMPYKPQDWQKEIYSIVKEAQLKALEVLGPGKTGAEVDKAARDFITSKGYGEKFNHSLGHGVGLLVHEGPTLSPYNNDVLLPGSLVTVEPGIYLPGKGGVRLEQLALITETGNQVLNKDRHFYKL
ncbi:MAG: Xaa-Pro peptidase family protein [Deltaproteobacteria bacterium]|jgi:Xaa-Pro aminopeptidase|nr:Xaa-Pro peptidase family protein [Deltaproteobacteria bacterium]